MDTFLHNHFLGSGGEGSLEARSCCCFLVFKLLVSTAGDSVLDIDAYAESLSIVLVVEGVGSGCTSARMQGRGVLKSPAPLLCAVMTADISGTPSHIKECHRILIHFAFTDSYLEIGKAGPVGCISPDTAAGF